MTMRGNTMVGSNVNYPPIKAGDSVGELRPIR
jgi:hypothetical protein